MTTCNLPYGDRGFLYRLSIKQSWRFNLRRIRLLTIDDASKEGAVVDPVEPQKVLEGVLEHWVDLKLGITTRHHWSVGIMRELEPKIKVYGGIYDKVQGCTHEVMRGDKIPFGVDTEVSCILTPCHTKGHVSYYVTGKGGEDPAIFTGDTLFVGGFGKFFEGTAEQMHESLCLDIGFTAKINPSMLWPRVKNMQFALTIEPENPRITEKLSLAKQRRSKGLPTVPSTIKQELETNLFMRVDLPDIQRKLGCKTAFETMQVLRQRKDNWKG